MMEIIFYHATIHIEKSTRYKQLLVLSFIWFISGEYNHLRTSRCILHMLKIPIHLWRGFWHVRSAKTVKEDKDILSCQLLECILLLLIQICNSDRTYQIPVYNGLIKVLSAFSIIIYSAVVRVFSSNILQSNLEHYYKDHI